MTKIISAIPIAKRIYLIRGHKVMLDADLADIYGVPTKRLNEQVKRNRSRFPSRYMFQLTSEEKSEVVANCDHLSVLRFSPALPYAFTEHGTIMLASVLNSKTAIKASMAVVDAFFQLRDLLSHHHSLSARLAELESKYDSQFRVVFDAIRELMDKPADDLTKVHGFKNE